MAKYKLDEHTQAILDSSVVPIGVFQMVDGRVSALSVSDGLCDLFGCKSREEAIEKVDNEMYWNVHPDDVERIEAATGEFIAADMPYNLVYRIKADQGYRLIHTRGQRITTETGERLAVVWYIDEGAVMLDAKAAESEEKIEELKASMHSLFNNMPAMSFSKDVETGVYLACNQAFAEYAHKETPSGVVGLTDHDIFDGETADHFVDCDKTALSMDEPYSYIENAFDAVGNPRQFRTTKLKFIDETGRLCLLGMSTDVTEVMKAKQENEQTKAAYQEVLSASAIYENIVDALVEDYFDLYYVDVETGEYIEYGSRTEEGKKATEKHGTDFFNETRENAKTFIYEEDRDRFIEMLDRERLLAEIEKHGAFIFRYRLLIDGTPTYVSLKATRSTGDDGHVIIGVSNVDSQVKTQKAAERALEEKKSYLRLSALNGNLIVLYFVDPETGEYTEFSSSKRFDELGIAKQGADFFQTTYENSLRTIHPEDQALFHAQITRENVLAAIERDGMFVLDYRLMSGDLPTYVRFKAAKIDENGKPLLIIGLLDEDAQIRQEQEYARNLSVARTMAVVDSLTGVKNKHAYVQWEEKIDTDIERGAQEPFALVICDINSLKAVNDLYGHKEGDACIKKVCADICSVFSHSPVFRVGGDEFAILLTGEDYDRRNDLLEQINDVPKDLSEIRIGETVAAGMSVYKRGKHRSLMNMFEEADKAMYDRKQYLKKTYSTTDDRGFEINEASDEIPGIDVRKCLLIADDIESNREMLGDLLEEDYDVLYAKDGVEALEVLRSHKGEIDLLLLDLIMPNKDGREVVSEMQVDDDLMSIPVVFLTVDQDAELDCLKIGAMDFIPKPYPDIEIVKARIDKCIELSEDRDLIRHTERDKLTGLLNKEYFYRYVSRLDHIYKEIGLDAVVCDVNRLHSINKRHGRQFGDHILRSLGNSIKKLARQTGGIGCRQEGDLFLLYCPHQDDYEQLLRGFLYDAFAEEGLADEITLRFGVFPFAGQEANVEERFDYAKIAADRVKDDPQVICGFYGLGRPPRPSR